LAIISDKLKQALYERVKKIPKEKLVAQKKGVKHKMSLHDISWLMDDLDVESFFDRMGWEITQRNGSVIRSYCPDHHYRTGRESSDPNWVLNMDTGETFCHTESHGSNLVYVVKNVMKFDDPDEAIGFILGIDDDGAMAKVAWRNLSKKFKSGETNGIFKRVESTVKDLEFVKKDIETLPVQEDGYEFFMHPPGKKRPTLISKETVDKFKVYQKPYGYYADRVILPVFMFEEIKGFVAIDILGAEEWFAQRPYLDIDNPKCKRKYKKVLYPKGFKSGQCLYGYDDLEEGADMIIITEGPREVMKIRQSGFNNVVSVFGTNFTMNHLELIKDKYPLAVYIMLDGDSAGRRSSEKIAKKINRFFTSYIVETKNGFDPKNLTEEEIRKDIENAKKYK